MLLKQNLELSVRKKNVWKNNTQIFKFKNVFFDTLKINYLELVQTGNVTQQSHFYKKSILIPDFEIKGTVSVITSDPPYLIHNTLVDVFL